MCIFFGIGQLLYFSRNNINQEAEYYNISMYFGILKRNYLYIQINWCEEKPNWCRIDDELDLEEISIASREDLSQCIARFI